MFSVEMVQRSRTKNIAFQKTDTYLYLTTKDYDVIPKSHVTHSDGNCRACYVIVAISIVCAANHFYIEISSWSGGDNIFMDPGFTRTWS